jgi:hypothetical protein
LSGTSRLKLGLVGLGLLAAGLLVALPASRYYGVYRDLSDGRDLLQQAEASLRDEGLDLTPAELSEAEAQMGQAQQRLTRAWQRLQADPLARFAGSVPALGSQVSATKELLAIGIDASEVGLMGIEATREYLDVRDERDGSLTEKARTILDRVDGPMSSLSARFAVLQERRRGIDSQSLLPPLAAALRELDSDLPEIEDALVRYQQASAFLPEFLGFNGPRTYLVLAQNNAELLPTGGLISVYGVMTLEDGHVRDMFFEDAIRFGERWQERTGEYVEPPAPLANYLLKDWSWNLALANWSPDFPTAARQAQRFFEMGGGQPVDGVLAITVSTLEELLKITGPVAVEEYGVTVDSENALDVIEALTRSPLEPGEDRKAIVAYVADEVLRRLLDAPPSQWSSLLDTVEHLREQKDILFYSFDEDVQKLVRDMGLDGGIQDQGGDYLMLVDASVNSTKLNIVLQQEVQVDIRLDELGNAQTRVDVSYENNLPAWEEGRDPQLVRKLMLGGMYGGYLRLLATARSRLLEVREGAQPVGVEEIGQEEGKTVFGRFFALPKGESTQLSFSYVAPSVVRTTAASREYRLFVQKQPGTSAIPLRVAITPPPGAQVLSVELDGSTEAAEAGEPVTGNAVEVKTDLSRDRELVVRYKTSD